MTDCHDPQLLFPLRTLPQLMTTCRHVVIRRLALTDLARFYAYRSDPEVGRYQTWTPLTWHTAGDFLVEMATLELLRPGQWSQLALADPSTDELLGDLGICIEADGRMAEIGFTLHPDATGRGVATAAVSAIVALLFRVTSVDSVIGITDERHTRSIRLLTRVGFRQVGEATVSVKGEWCRELTWMIRR